jgi:hypothetical protein
MFQVRFNMDYVFGFWQHAEVGSVVEVSGILTFTVFKANASSNESLFVQVDNISINSDVVERSHGR